AAARANGGHGSTERMSGKPERSLVVDQRLFNTRPELIDLALEPAMNSTSSFGHSGECIEVGLNVVPLVGLGASADDDGVVVVGKQVGLGPVAVVIANVGKPHVVGKASRISSLHIGDVGDFGKQERLTERTYLLDRPPYP